MIPISIDLEGVFEEFSMSAQESGNLVDFVVKEVTARTAEAWANEAKRILRSSRAQYLRSLIVVDKGRFEGAVVLTGVVPNMVERGADPFDMKAGFSRSSKKKYNKKGGWYLTIPFRFASAGALGESDVFSGILPKEVYQEIKQTPVKQNIDISKLPEGQQIPGVRKQIIPKSSRIPISTNFKEYQHKTSIFSGLQKRDSSSANKTSSQFVSFRRVGSESDDNAFIHKGMVARNLAEKAIDIVNIPVLTDKLVDEFLLVR